MEINKEVLDLNSFLRQNNPLVGWEINPSTSEIQLSKGIYPLFGLASGSIKCESDLLVLFESTYSVIFNKNLLAARIDGEEKRFDLEYTSGSGIKKWIRAHIYPVIQDGEVENILGTFQDVTAENLAARLMLDKKKYVDEIKLLHKQTEQLIKLSENNQNLLHEVLQKAYEGFISVTPDIKCKYINDEGARLLNLNPEDLLGRDLNLVFQESDVKLFPDISKIFNKRKEAICLNYISHLDCGIEFKIVPNESSISIFFKVVSEQPTT